MSSGKGGSGKRTVYMGTIAGVLGEGPAHSFRQFLVNAKAVWTGPLLRAAASNPTTITLAGYGNAQVFFGTEDQPVSTVLAKYGIQPAYRGSVVVVLNDIRFGDSGETNPPNLEVVWRREPDQDIVTTLTGDGCFTVTIPAHAAELLTSWSWAGLPQSALNVASFTALEAALVGDPRNAIAPLYSDQCSVRAALADCAAVADAWLRVDTAGKIEVGHWPRSGPGAVTAFDFEDLTESPDIEVDDVASLPNAISVEFRDSSKLHKANATLVPDAAAIRRAGGRVRRQTAKRSMLNTLAAAKRHGADLLASESRPGVVITLSVFRSLAVRPDGQRIRPGDYFIAPVQLLPEAPAVPRLFRCTGRKLKVRGPITLTGELDRSAPAAAAIAASDVVEIERVLPPVNWVRVFGAPAGSSDLPPVYVVAARPADGCTGYDVRYDPDQDGDFPSIGNEPGCALPLRLQADCSASAAEVTVQLLPVTGDGANPRRDEHLIRNWSGGLVEGRDDRLLLVLLKIAGNGQIEASGTAEYAEILSVAGPASIVSADTFTIPVLRGRKGTPARAFDAGAWSDVEAWLVPAGSLQAQRHADWIAAATAGDTIYFRFRPYALGVEYHGETAYAERLRRAAASEPLEEYAAQPDETDAPTVPYRIPAGYLAGSGDDGADDYTDLMEEITPPSGAVTYSCRTKGGTASLAGWRAFKNPTTPPTTYLNKGGNADTAWNRYNTNCTAPDSTPSGYCTGSGSFQIDPHTGTKTGQWHTYCSTSGDHYYDDQGGANGWGEGCDGCGACAEITSPTTCIQYLQNPTCCVDNGVGYILTAVSGTLTLSNPDNEQYAISRLMATAEWSEWAATSLPGCASTYGIRTDLAFPYVEAEFKITASGLAANGFHVVKVHLAKTELSSGVTTEAEVQEFDIFADGTGATEFTTSLPVERGFAYFVQRVTYHTI